VWFDFVPLALPAHQCGSVPEQYPPAADNRPAPVLVVERRPSSLVPCIHGHTFLSGLTSSSVAAHTHGLL
jgi:hypothetical protein